MQTASPGLILKGKQAGRVEVATTAARLVHSQKARKKKEGRKKRKLILQKTPWVLRKLVRTVKKLQKI